MASCKKCGSSVGCGCQLKNGMCSYCANKTSNNTKTKKDVITEIDKLQQLS